MPNEDMKQCTKCGQWKDTECFYKGKAQCKKCYREYKREYYKQNKDIIREYYKQNKDTIREYKCGYYKQNKDTIREYREQNKDTIREYKREYYKQNKDTIREYREQNKEKRREYKREYYEQNKDTLLERQREYMKTPQGRRVSRIAYNNRRARKLSLPDTLTSEQWQYALNYFGGRCAICDRQLNDIFGEFTAAADHWIPLSYEGDDNPGTVAGNIIPLCHGVGGCNNSKSNTMPDEWLERQFGKRKAKQIAAKIQDYFDSLTHIKGVAK